MLQSFQMFGQVSDNSFIIPINSPSAFEGVCSITFYSDEYNTPVKPTAGKATFEISEDSFNYGSIENGVITFPDTDGYNRPHFIGYAGAAKVTLNGITGATHFIARVHMG